jgi:pyruvate,orthophosphate dikinase
MSDSVKWAYSFGDVARAEARVVAIGMRSGILLENLIDGIDADGVGRPIEMAVKAGREVRADLEVGICGEHGGDPRSIALCHQYGLDYVSCSPFRVPFARLVAAHAALDADEASRRAES